jgi:hypothetical protein
MMTSSRGLALSVAVTRHFEFSRLQEQSIACAYEALIPVVTWRPQRSRPQRADLPRATIRTECPQSSAAGA